MSKVVTFFNPNNNYSITRNININDADLTMPDNIFDKILFLSDTKIIITENNVIDGNLLLQSDVIDFIQVIDSLKTKKKINICNRVWNG